jgi:hypothetical protein
MINNVNTTLVNSNNSLIYTTTGPSYIELGSDITDFLELTLAALGYDIKYSDFKQMTAQERNQLIRDIKIKTIL